MVGRVPCGVCKLQSSSPNNFLLLCACGIACHHRCLKPPMAHSSLLVMIDAFNRGVHEKSIRAWRCATCLDTTSKLRNQPPPPVPAQCPTLVDNEVKNNPGPHNKKTVVSRRVHGWRNNPPAPVKPSQRLHIDSSVAAWPPVRHKNKSYSHLSAVKDIGGPAREAMSLKVNVAPTKLAEGTFSLKPSVGLHPPATKDPRPKPKLDPMYTPVFVAKMPPTSSNSRLSKLKGSVGGSLASSCPGGSALAQTTATTSKNHTVPLVGREGIDNYSHVEEDIFKMNHLIPASKPLPRNGDRVEDIVINDHPENSAVSRNVTVTRASFPVLPSTSARCLYEFPSSSTAPGKRNKRKYHPDAVIQPMSGEKAGHTPSVATPPRWRPQLIDLHKPLKQKRSTVRRSASATSSRSNLGVPESWDVVSVSRQDSAFDGYPLKRRKLDMSNTEKSELKTPGRQVDVATQEQNALILAAEGKHIKGAQSALPPKALTNEQFHRFSPINRTKRRKLDVQTWQTAEIAHPQLHPPDTEARHANADHHTSDETNQIPQLASPATSHRSVEALVPDDSPSRDSPLEAKLVPFPITVLRSPENLLPIHDQIVAESHLLPPPSLPTPRSLSPSCHPVPRSVLDDAVARLQLQDRNNENMRLPKLPESKVKLPQLARWFKELGTNLISTSTRDKRKRWKTPNPKAMMVGLSDGWSFVGARVRTT